ncbi:MAG: hypothetical protein WC795_00540 [Candidatus Paceibacterota bacterium]|jgi:hypothetical protein
MNKNTIAIISALGIIILTGVVGYFLLTSKTQPQPIKVISSFEECAQAGYPILESYPEQCQTPDGQSFTKGLTPQEAVLGNQVTLRVNEQVKFDDGLVITLTEINDSRCKQGVQCIWQGELSSTFIILGGNVSEFKEIQLGTVTAKSATQNGYTFTLKEATEINATITVTKKATISPPTPTPTPIPPVACTADAKQCSDGSYVGRTGPKCEFTACPGENSAQVSLREGQREGPLLVQKIYPTYITGQVYREYPVATDQGSPITMYIGDSASNGCTVTLTLIRIQNGIAVFTKTTDYNRPCPICLAENTFIDTPAGEIAVQNLTAGMEVWTVNNSGIKVSAKILKTGRTLVPETHRVMHFVLSDNRELFVSPGHPTSDGRLAGTVLAGDTLDGAKVLSAILVPYEDEYTYDILPAGETGQYWSNGILMSSTLITS